MNKQQRKDLADAISALEPFTDADHCLEQGVAAVISAVDDAKSVFESMAEEEREKFDNMPEGLQQSERGSALEEAAEALEEAVVSLENIDLSEHVKPEDGWHEEVSEFIQEAIDNAESF